MTSSRTAVGAMLDERSEAIWTKDIDRLMSFYSDDVVYFDLVPPLRYAGSAALRGRFLNWFDGFESPIRQDIHELNVQESGDIAVSHMLIRAGGTLTNGPEVGFWVRATSCCRWSGDGWLIMHEHVSLPVDLASRQAATDLVP